MALRFSQRRVVMARHGAPNSEALATLRQLGLFRAKRQPSHVITSAGDLLAFA